MRSPSLRISARTSPDRAAGTRIVNDPPVAFCPPRTSELTRNPPRLSANVRIFSAASAGCCTTISRKLVRTIFRSAAAASATGGGGGEASLSALNVAACISPGNPANDARYTIPLHERPNQCLTQSPAHVNRHRARQQPVCLGVRNQTALL